MNTNLPSEATLRSIRAELVALGTTFLEHREVGGPLAQGLCELVERGEAKIRYFRQGPPAFKPTRKGRKLAFLSR